MPSPTTEVSGSDLWERERPDNVQMGWALVVLWSRDEPIRVGEVAWLPQRGNARMLGRGEAAADETEERVEFLRQRPGRNLPTGALEGKRISRRQLLLKPTPSGISVTNVGRCSLLVDGRPTDEATVQAGSTLQLKNQVLLLVTRRPSRLAPCVDFDSANVPEFGEADRFGIVGESPAAWALRERLGFIARRDGVHVLIAGPSGAGKELAARALHAMSGRSRRTLVARNAATLPEGLIDAELFGNVRDYPNPGMRERKGLVGEANGSTLFLDEIGELPEALQAHLLRVLDGDGEYQRLGDSRQLRSDLRLVAATNRDASALKHDLAARLPLRLELPGFDARPEDIPLLSAHLLRATATSDDDVGARFFEGWGSAWAFPRVSPALMDRLVRHAYTHHARELQSVLWKAMASSTGGVLELTDEAAAGLQTSGEEHTDPSSVGADAIRAALQAHEGNRTRAARELGLKNRDVLYRLMRKHGVE